MVLCALCLTLGAGASHAATDSSRVVQLGTGVFGGNARWRITAHRKPNPGGTAIPCIYAELSPSRPGPGAADLRFGVCHPISAELPLGFSPSAGEGRQRRTLIVLAFPAQAVKVRLELRGRRDRLLPLRRITRFAQRRTGLGSFSWLAVPFSGPICAQRAVAMDSRGTPIGRPYDLHCT